MDKQGRPVIVFIGRIQVSFVLHFLQYIRKSLKCTCCLRLIDILLQPLITYDSKAIFLFWIFLRNDQDFRSDELFTPTGKIICLEFLGKLEFELRRKES